MGQIERRYPWARGDRATLLAFRRFGPAATARDRLFFVAAIEGAWPLCWHGTDVDLDAIRA